MKDGHAMLLIRIDLLDTKMHAHVEKMEERIMNEIRRVNGKVNDRHA
jgi:hypothetical protein